jgi:acyl-coenzyme A thioesterase PaaI-like protein
MIDVNDRPIFLKPGHNAGDLLESREWKILREERGLVEVEAHLPSHLLNPRDQLFGGFTGTYVDMISIWTVRTLFDSTQTQTNRLKHNMPPQHKVYTQQER